MSSPEAAALPERKPTRDALRSQCANAIRALAMDAVQATHSGHPGMPMGMADIAEALWHHHLRHNPADPKWLDRFGESAPAAALFQHFGITAAAVAQRAAALVGAPAAAALR